MTDVQIERYTTRMAADVAALIETSFTELRQAPPIRLLSSPPEWCTREELLATLTSGKVRSEASFVALDQGEVVSCAIVTSSDEENEWWRVATAIERRREGLASRCMAAGEEVLAATGETAIATGDIFDSRWEAAVALFGALGYELEDPERRNITMAAEDWQPRAVELPDGYALDTFGESDLDEWIAVRNAVFGSERDADWFGERFMSRPDWDETGWFVVRHQDHIVGIASGICVEDERDPEVLRGGQIEWVGVLGEHRGLHLGEELMVACLNFIAERDFLPALLITQPFRVPAVRLYEKLGFRTTAAWQRWMKELK